MDSVAVAPRQNDALLRNEQKPGGWEPINVKDPYMQEMGRFAVMEHTHKLVGASLKFIRVVSGEARVVEGKEYSLVVEVEEQLVVYPMEPSSIKLYVAVVLDKPWKQSWELLRFEPFTLPPLGPGPVIPPN